MTMAFSNLASSEKVCYEKLHNLALPLSYMLASPGKFKTNIKESELIIG